MPERSISLLPQNGSASVTAINCGNSTPRLGGAIDISAFPNLINFTCNNNDITSISDFSDNGNLEFLSILDNKLTGAIPSLENLSKVSYLDCGLNQFTGSIPPLSSNTTLNTFYCFNNNLTGNIPTINNAMQYFSCSANVSMSGSIPSLAHNTNLILFHCSFNGLTGSIPSLETVTNMYNFQCNGNSLTGTIPSLTNLTNLQSFSCNGNQLTNFAGGSVSITLGNFQATNNQLPSSAIDNLLAAFVTANRTTGTRVLSLQGAGNSPPTSVGVLKTTLVGTAFSRSGTTVTVSATAHGYITGDWVTITGITQSAFQGTFAITRINDDVFQYTTISTGTLTGSGTATLRKTSIGNTSGFRSYQNLALVSRTGGPWTININFPA
jgi:hypothetical protein